MLEICIKVTGYTNVRCSIHTVGCKTDFNDRLCLETEIFLCRSSHNCLRVKDHDTVMRLTYTEFILCADHTKRLDTAYLRLLDLEIFAKYRTYCSKKNLLSCSYIRRATNDLEKLRCACIELCYMEVVRIRVLHTLYYLCYYYTCKSARYFFNLF